MLVKIERKIGLEFLMRKTLRLKRGIFTTGILCLLGFLAMGTFSVATTMLAPPPKARLDPIYMAIFFGLFWGAWSCLAIWILLTYWRERLTVTDENVIQRGVIRTQVVGFDEIKSLIWKPSPPQVRLIAETTRVKIHLANFEPTDQLWSIRQLQQRIPESVQDGWEVFCAKAAVPLCRHETGRLAHGQVAVTRKRWAWYFLPATLLFAILGIVLSLTLGLHRLWIAPLPILVLWALLHFSTPRKGLAVTRIPAVPGNSRFLLFLLFWGGVALVGSFVLFAVNPRFPPTIAWLAIGGILWFVVLIYKAEQVDRLRQRNDEDRIPMALKEWAESDSKS